MPETPEQSPFDLPELESVERGIDFDTPADDEANATEAPFDEPEPPSRI